MVFWCIMLLCDCSDLFVCHILGLRLSSMVKFISEAVRHSVSLADTSVLLVTLHKSLQFCMAENLMNELVSQQQFSIDLLHPRTQNLKRPENKP